MKTIIMIVSAIILLSGCNSNKKQQILNNEIILNNVDIEKIRNYIEKDKQKIAKGEKITDSARMEEEMDIEIPLVEEALKKYGYKTPTETEYIKKVKDFFGVDLNNLQNNCKQAIILHKNFCVLSTIDANNVALEGGTTYDFVRRVEFASENRNILFLNSHKFILIPRRISDIVKITGDSLTVKIPEEIIHLNLYVLNGRKSSLIWLINNYGNFLLNEMLCILGYDKDETINEYVIKDLYSVREKFGHKDSPLDDYIARKSYCNDTLQIREGLMKTFLSISEKDNYYDAMLDDYGLYLTGGIASDDTEAEKYANDTHKYPNGPYYLDFTRAERLKIIAYIVYYLRKIEEKTGKSSTFASNEIGDDEYLLQNIRENNYYNLPNYKSMVSDMQDEYYDRVRYQPNYYNNENECVIDDKDGYTNMRLGKGVKFDVILKIPDKANIYVLDRTDENWWKVSYDNNIGYVHKSRIKKVEDNIQN